VYVNRCLVQTICDLFWTYLRTYLCASQGACMCACVHVCHSNHGSFMCDMCVCHAWLMHTSHGAFMRVCAIRVMAHSCESMAHLYATRVLPSMAPSYESWLIHGAFMRVSAIRVTAQSYEIMAHSCVICVCAIHGSSIRDHGLFMCHMCVAIHGSFMRVMARSYESWRIMAHSCVICVCAIHGSSIRDHGLFMCHTRHGSFIQVMDHSYVCLPSIHGSFIQVMDHSCVICVCDIPGSLIQAMTHSFRVMAH